MNADCQVPEGKITLDFTDIEDSSLMTNELRNEDYLNDMRQPHCVRIREAIVAHNGYEVKTMGDSFMVAFQRADDALACVAEIQRRLRKPPLTATDPTGKELTVKVRIGVHTAEQELFPFKDKDGRWDYGGGDVNFAAPPVKSCL